MENKNILQNDRVKYCSNCGTALSCDDRFCSNCGTKVDILIKDQPVLSKSKQSTIKIFMICLIVIVVGIISIYTIINMVTSLDGEYKCLTDDMVFKLKQTDREEGTFEIYVNGKSIDKSNKRYIKTWERDDDLLILKYDDDTTYYFLITDDALIELYDEDEEPNLSEYVAPVGRTFDYEIKGMTFYENGTYEYEFGYYWTATGSYYCENNIIYCKNNPFKLTGYISTDYPGEDEYSPRYYIYNDNYITNASHVYLKK